MGALNNSNQLGPTPPPLKKPEELPSLMIPKQPQEQIVPASEYQADLNNKKIVFILPFFFRTGSTNFYRK